jgi:ABC-type transport system involved in multi-copper enzyme maturation permease subunit
MEALRETVLIARHDLRHSVRSTKAILLLLIYGSISVAAGALVVWGTARIQEEVQAQLAQVGVDASEIDLQADAEEAYREVMTVLVGDPEKAAYLTAIPIVVLFFFWGTRNFLPWLIVLMGYDQISGETQNRSIRYLLLRARRGALVAGKILSNLVLLLGLTVLANVFVFVFAALMIEGFDTASASRHLARFWLLTLPLGLAWIAFMSFLSALLKSPRVSLLFGLAMLVGSAVVGWIARISDTLSFMQWLVPWHYGGQLLSHRASDQLVGVAGFMAFAVLFSVLSYLTLRWRDV